MLKRNCVSTDKGPERFLHGIIEKKYAAIDEWQTEMQVKAMKRGNIFLYTEGLTKDQQALTGVTVIESPLAAVTESVKAQGDRRVAVIPEGPYVIPLFVPRVLNMVLIRMAGEGPRIILREIFNKSLLAVDPYKAVASYSDTIRRAYKSGNFRKLVLIGFGKAASLMSKAIEDNLGDVLAGGIIVTKYGHSVRGDKNSKIITYEAGHPLPDENGLKAAKEIVRVLKEADKNTLVICLISGGGSALLVAPYRNITLADKQEVTGMLLKAGADIYELNTVRKHISAVKGGRLAEAAQPATIISLILSDVMGDRLDMIASGPTAPDKTTYNEANNVFRKYKLEDRLPSSVAEIIGKGIRGLMPETPKDDDPVFQQGK